MLKIIRVFVLMIVALSLVSAPVVCGDRYCDPEYENSEGCNYDCKVPGGTCGDRILNEGEECESNAIVPCNMAAGENCYHCKCVVGAPACGDGKCQVEEGENCKTCLYDCGECVPYCGNGECDRGAYVPENCLNCPRDCGACVTSTPTCGNNILETGEECEGTIMTCSTGTCVDCKCSSVPSCGDGRCSYPDESCGTCPLDCGACPGAVCGNRILEGGEECEMLAYPCAQGTCTNCKCETPSVCGDWICGTGENTFNCCEDCGCVLAGDACINGNCVQGGTCGDGRCEAGESWVSCCEDCGCLQGDVCKYGICTSPGVCGDGIVDEGETPETCCLDVPCGRGYACNKVTLACAWSASGQPENESISSMIERIIKAILRSILGMME